MPTAAFASPSLPVDASPIDASDGLASVGRVGFWSGLAAFAATAAYVVVQLAQVAGVVHPPLDAILIYGTSLCIVVPFVLEMVALHHLTRPSRRFWTHAALMFTVMYAVFVTANYVVQLATVIPATTAGLSDGMRVLEQTPHSMFWDFDALGYVCMGIATLLAVPALGSVGFERWVRRSLLANALVTPLIGIVYFHPRFSTRLLFVGSPWGITAPLFMLLLAIALRRRGDYPIAAARDTLSRCDPSAIRSTSPSTAAATIG
ncbi:MAG TPA: hypothetical protein VF761_14025 [Gemmatimonadaceae bacterium]